MGQFIRVEEHTHKGRSDAVVQTDGAVYVFEFKITSAAEASSENARELALAVGQIEESGYADAYEASGKRIYIIAITFSIITRNISDWLIA
jgi:hypothetical protein